MPTLNDVGGRGDVGCLNVVREGGEVLMSMSKLRHSVVICKRLAKTVYHIECVFIAKRHSSRTRILLEFDSLSASVIELCTRLS
jgi:hypothetical protein